jgi:hypothetical protein
MQKTWHVPKKQRSLLLCINFLTVRGKWYLDYLLVEAVTYLFVVFQKWIGVLWFGREKCQQNKILLILFKIFILVRGWDSSIGIATRYGLDRIPVGGEIFRTRPGRPWSPPSLLYNGYRLFPERKAAGAWHWLPTSSNAEVEERVELYLFSPSGPSWPVLCLPLTFMLLWKTRITCWTFISIWVKTQRSVYFQIVA